ncbi:peroxisomal membrane protein PEX14 [Aspergillus saccharolyticus JOP 1030-1]|uniref:Peroxisomal membrane protein PEX14 n=1 Tax=Aspergillus saccharolyticus JOP 1030-1 TaxID=1450539 RepID=A0A318ZE06_9EURO|nr:hypothetical protein BP01DRAFT_57760 [Aspergillus saccharolyticus JOP 1030-1]PYH44847.1 hypothetical protein BP01DRAFT_57760 [Aspergillus saccharolyticus JOP 1030-1]
MADKPKSSIPEWQKSNATPESNSSSAGTNEADIIATDSQPSRSELLDQAAKFLEDDSIREAPIEQKRTFLESKGLSSDEIDVLLNQSSAEPSTSGKEHSSDDDHQTAATSSSSSRNATPPSSPPASTTSSSSSPSTHSNTNTNQPATTRQQPRDIAPIITYPEFLTTPTPNPPLITLRSTLYTLYGAAGLATTFYAASEYLIKPMIAQLTAARHDLARTATTNLHTLNARLEQTVSTIPDPKPSTSSHHQPPAPESDTESIASDPTELFHRDVAVQTTSTTSTPPEPSLITHLPPHNSEAEEADAAAQKVADPVKTACGHTARMQALTAQLRAMTETEQTASDMDTALRGKLNDLHHYLDTYIYSKPGVFNPMAGYGVFSTPGLDATGGTAGGGGNGGNGSGSGSSKGGGRCHCELPDGDSRGQRGVVECQEFPGRGQRRCWKGCGRRGVDAGEVQSAECELRPGEWV